MRHVGFFTRLVALALALGGPARAQGLDPLRRAEEAAEAARSDEEAEVEARLEKLRRRLVDRGARVVVLRWPDGDVGHEHPLVQALVRNRTGRSDARFVPEIDLYQEGRLARAATGAPLPPREQPGTVPPEVVDQVRAEVRQARARLGEQGFGDAALAGRLTRLVPRIWFNDRPETREALFDLYLTIGQAAAGIPEQTPPLYQMIGDSHANYYLYLAAAMLWEERRAGEARLEARKPRGPVGRWLDDLVRLVEDGTHPPIPLAFHEGGLFDAPRFARTWRVVINGLERVVDDSGLVLVPRGRVDVSLERGKVGHGLSEHLEVVRLDEKIYFVVEVARQKTGWELLSQLVLHPYACEPSLRRETLAALAAYAALHPNYEVFVAIPRGGSARDVLVWRWDRQAHRLVQLVDRTRGFPVTFAALATGGLTFSGGGVPEARVAELTTPRSEDVAAGRALLPRGEALRDLVRLAPSGVPIDLQLRAHFDRLMVGGGLTFTASVAKGAGGVWRERWPVDGDVVVPRDAWGLPEPPEALRERAFARLGYGLIGVVAGRDAAAGRGPRAYLRVGGRDTPHAVDVTAHLGLTHDATFGKRPPRGRLAPILDVDLYGGVLIPYGETLFCVRGDRARCATPLVLPNLGLSVGAGLTF